MRGGSSRSAGLLALAALAAHLLVNGCDFARRKGGEAPTTPSSPAAAVLQARLSVLILPSPVIVSRDRRDPSSGTARWTVEISETAGVGGTLGFVNATVRDAATGAPVEPRGFLSMDVAEIRRVAGTERLRGGGTLGVPQSLTFDGAPSGATLSVAVQLLDDNGNLVGRSATAKVQ